VGAFFLPFTIMAGIIYDKGEYLIEMNSGGMFTWLIVTKIIVPVLKKTAKDMESAASA